MRIALGLPALIFAASTFGFIAPALAFEGEVHESITRAALKELGYRDSGADLVVAGNLATDKDEFNDPAAHFDSETFEGGSARLRDKIDAAVASVMNCDRDAALESMGRALHATQDFFAHSNFTERGDRLGTLDLLHMTNPASDAVCKPPLFQGPLTTGYWPDDNRPKPYKCIHAELNKDAPLEIPRFVRARALALAESKIIIGIIEERIRTRFHDLGDADAVVGYLRLGPIALEGSRMTCPLLGDAPDNETCNATPAMPLGQANLAILRTAYRLSPY